MKKSVFKKVFATLPFVFLAADLIELVIAKSREKQGDYAYFFPEAQGEISDAIRLIREENNNG